MNGIELDAVLSVDDVAVEYGLVLAVVPSVLMRIVHYRAAVSAVGTIVISRRLVCICENGRVWRPFGASVSLVAGEGSVVNFASGYVTVLVVGDRGADGAATRAALDDGREPASVLLIEVRVKDGIDARIRRA